MPPRRGRPSKAPRGRGRGKSSTGHELQATEEPSAVTNTTGAEGNDTNEGPQTTNDIPRIATVNPPQIQSPQAPSADQISPGLEQSTSFATMSAASPPRPPVQRLETLLDRPASKASLANSKYKPKAIGRRNQAEREALESQAAFKEQQRLAEVARVQAADARRARLSLGHFGGRNRGRGAPSRAMFGQRNKGEVRQDASGPLSVPSTERKAPRRGSTGGRAGKSTARTAGSSSGGGTKKSTTETRGRTRSKIKSENAIDVSASVEEGEDFIGKRRNIDYIYISSDDDDVEFIGEKRLKPMRLERVEHKERHIGVNTEASSAKAAQIRREEMLSDVKKEPGLDDASQSKGKARAGKKDQDVEFIRDGRTWKGVYPDEDPTGGTQIKQEREEDVLTTGVEAEAEADKTAAATRQTKDEEANDENLPSTTTRRRRLAQRLQPPVLTTDEDKEEWNRILDSRATLVEELSLSESLTFPEGGEDSAKQQVDDHRRDRVYMFQLPPKVPNLKEVDKHGDDVSANTAVREGGNADDAIEIDGKEDNSSNPLDVLCMHAADNPTFTGQIGMLNVYEDGHTEFSWGGIEHEVHVGCGGDLLQEVIVTDIPEPRDVAASYSAEDEDKKVGTAMAMGQLSGKFVVTPAWNKLFEKI